MLREQLSDITELKAWMRHQEQTHTKLHHQLRIKEDMLRAGLASRSERTTAALRAMVRAVRGLDVAEFGKRLGRPVFERSVAVLRHYPAAKPYVWRFISLVPGARAKLEHFVMVRDAAARARRLQQSLEKQPVLGSSPPVSLQGRAVLMALKELVSEEPR